MFVIISHYLKPLAELDIHLAAHRTYLQQAYDRNYFFMSGPQIPRQGGIILSQLQDKHILEDFLASDPFVIHGICTYQIIEFQVVQHHRDVEKLLN